MYNVRLKLVLTLGTGMPIVVQPNLISYYRSDHGRLIHGDRGLLEEVY